MKFLGDILKNYARYFMVNLIFENQICCIKVLKSVKNVREFNFDL